MEVGDRDTRTHVLFSQALQTLTLESRHCLGKLFGPSCCDQVFERAIKNTGLEAIQCVSHIHQQVNKDTHLTDRGHRGERCLLQQRWELLEQSRHSLGGKAARTLLRLSCVFHTLESHAVPGTICWTVFELPQFGSTAQQLRRLAKPWRQRHEGFRI